MRKTRSNCSNCSDSLSPTCKFPPDNVHFGSGTFTRSDSKVGRYCHVIRMTPKRFLLPVLPYFERVQVETKKKPQSFAVMSTTWLVSLPWLWGRANITEASSPLAKQVRVLHGLTYSRRAWSRGWCLRVRYSWKLHFWGCRSHRLYRRSGLGPFSCEKEQFHQYGLAYYLPTATVAGTVSSHSHSPIIVLGIQTGMNRSNPDQGKTNLTCRSVLVMTKMGHK